MSRSTSVSPTLVYHSDVESVEINDYSDAESMSEEDMVVEVQPAEDPFMRVDDDGRHSFKSGARRNKSDKDLWKKLKRELKKSVSVSRSDEGEEYMALASPEVNQRRKGSNVADVYRRNVLEQSDMTSSYSSADGTGHRMSVSMASMPEPKQGYLLLEKGVGSGFIWKRCYCACKTGGLYLYEKSAEVTDPTKCLLCVKNDEMDSIEPLPEKQEFSFIVEAYGTSYVFCCGSPLEREKWIAWLRRESIANTVMPQFSMQPSNAPQQGGERFLSRDFLHQWLRQERKKTLIGDQAVDSEKELTILFSDVRDFTSISELIGPMETMALLNELFKYLVPVVRRYKGIVDKIVGDCLFCCFYSPFLATSAAIAIQEIVQAFNADIKSQVEEILAVTPGYDSHIEATFDQSSINALLTGDSKGASFRPDSFEPIRVGIGLATGPVVFGTLGDRGHKEGTFLGDTVNVASRLEGLSKQYGCPILCNGRSLLRLYELASGKRMTPMSPDFEKMNTEPPNFVLSPKTLLIDAVHKIAGDEMRTVKSRRRLSVVELLAELSTSDVSSLQNNYGSPDDSPSETSPFRRLFTPPVPTREVEISGPFSLPDNLPAKPSRLQKSESPGVTLLAEAALYHDRSRAGLMSIDLDELGRKLEDASSASELSDSESDDVDAAEPLLDGDKSFGSEISHGRNEEKSSGSGGSGTSETEMRKLTKNKSLSSRSPSARSTRGNTTPLSIFCNEDEDVETLECQILVRYIDTVRVVGKRNFERLFEVIMPDSPVRRIVIPYWKAFNLYCDRKFDVAADLLTKECLTVVPFDTASRLLRERCNKCMNEKLPPDWEPVSQITSK